MDYPTLEQVEQADRMQICRWYRFLPSPVFPDEEEVMGSICRKFKEFGGFTPDISKAIGW